MNPLDQVMEQKKKCKNTDVCQSFLYLALVLVILFMFSFFACIDSPYCICNWQEEDLEEEALTHDEPERPLKRLRLRGQGGQVSPSVNACNQSLGGSSVKRPKVEEDELPKTSFRQQPREIKETPQRNIVNKGKQPLLPQIEPLGKRSMSERAASIRIKEPMAEPGIASLPKQKVPETHVLIKPKDEPFTDDMFSSDVPDYEVPIAVIRPGASLFPCCHSLD